MDEREIFKGSEKTLTMKQTYTHEFQCHFKIAKYPFDRQSCSIEMTTTDTDAPTMRLLPKQLFMEQHVDMTLFHMDNWNLDYTNMDVPQKGISIQISLKRKIMSEMLTTYLPSFLLLMITFATTFFKPFFFEAALSVNLTTMLVMTTIFISKMEGLPPTSDIKMIDIWLILCQIYPFLEVVLLTAMEYSREDDIDESSSLVEEGAIAETNNANLKTLGRFFLYHVCLSPLR